MHSNDEVIQNLPLKDFSAGDIVIQEGGLPGVLYFLKNGSVEISKDGVSIAVVKETGAVFGEMSVLLNSVHTATVRATVDSIFYAVDQPSEFLEEHPGIAAYVATILAKRIDALNKYLVDVKPQVKDQAGKVWLVDEVLDAIMAKHYEPRKIGRNPIRD